MPRARSAIKVPMPHTVVLAGGGTGGHVYPALAMGDELRARGHHLLYYGDAGRLEGRVAPERGYAFRAVEAVQFPRSGLWSKLKFATQLLSATWKARGRLREDRATLVLGVGGYVMAPTVLAAYTLGIPAAIHEANVAPGLANRLCARVAKLVLLTYEETRPRLPGAAEKITVGCPVNPKVLQGSPDKYSLPVGKPVLLVVGGSLGAAKINEVALACANDPARTYTILHLTGPRYFDEVAAAYKALPGGVPDGVVVRAYEDKMGDAFAAATLVLARSGSSTLAELCAIGKASVLIPSPNVTDNHQEANARGIERVGGAVVVTEAGLDPAEVAQRIAVLIADEPKVAAMAAAARGLAKPNVAAQVADLLMARFSGG